MNKGEDDNEPGLRAPPLAQRGEKSVTLGH